jgi:hypothetical protein
MNSVMDGWFFKSQQPSTLIEGENVAIPLVDSKETRIKIQISLVPMKELKPPNVPV